jgi:hypothetical protein
MKRFIIRIFSINPNTPICLDTVFCCAIIFGSANDQDVYRSAFSTVNPDKDTPMCDVSRKVSKSFMRICVLEGLILVGCCQMTTTANGQASAQSPTPAPPKPIPAPDAPTNPTNPTAQTTAYTLANTNLTINYWMQVPAMRVSVIDGGAISPAAPFIINYVPPTVDPATTQPLTVVFSLNVYGLPSKDYTVTTMAALTNGQYQIPDADMQTFVTTLLCDINRNLCLLPDLCTTISFDLAVPVNVSATTPTQLAAGKAAASKAAAVKAAAAKDAAANTAAVMDAAAQAAATANTTAQAAAAKDPMNAILAAQAKAAAQRAADAATAQAAAAALKATTEATAQDTAVAAFNDQVAAAQAAAANKPADKNTPKPQSKMTSNNLTITLQRVLGP